VYRERPAASIRRGETAFARALAHTARMSQPPAAPPSSPHRFAGRVAVVTGAASGIGHAAALRLGREGAAVGCVDRDAAGAEATAAELRALGARALAVGCDVARSAEVDAAARRIEAELGPAAALANVAGIGDVAGNDGIENLPDDRWQRVLDVDLGGPFFWCRALLPGMAARGAGAVVNVSSLAGRSKSANANYAYSASKAGLLGLTRHLAFDYGRRGVRVNAICPGGVDTPMLRAAATLAARSPEATAARAKALAAYQFFMPIQRLSTADEQAAAILWLLSDDASYVNGVSLDVNGGLYMA
jgi:NAD(P)-dependent dehydrogenase (short-subunit alcohol dehydrogenase family)